MKFALCREVLVELGLERHCEIVAAGLIAPMREALEASNVGALHRI